MLPVLSRAFPHLRSINFKGFFLVLNLFLGQTCCPVLALILSWNDYFHPKNAGLKRRKARFLIRFAENSKHWPGPTRQSEDGGEPEMVIENLGMGDLSSVTSAVRKVEIGKEREIRRRKMQLERLILKFMDRALFLAISHLGCGGCSTFLFVYLPLTWSVILPLSSSPRKVL